MYLYRFCGVNCMDISLPKNIENKLKEKIAEGIFSTMEEAVAFAIQIAIIDGNITPQRIIELNNKIEKGWSEMESGMGRDSKDVFADLRKRYA